MEVRKSSHKVVVFPNITQQWVIVGVVLIEERIMTTDYNLRYFACLLPQRISTRLIGHNSSHEIE
jgi:hypothetical protein